MSTVTFAAASRTYAGTAKPAVDALDLDVADGEFVTLVGPSGSGKSTALRMLAGLEPVDSGALLLGEQPVTDRPPRDRDLAMVFQSYALYPHMSVSDNIGFPLRMAGVGRSERRTRVEEVASLLGLEAYLDRRPRQLSGGQRQRVAMGRAIIRKPAAFLMDEPLSNLDAQLRAQTRASLAELQSRLGITTIYVTHDQVEAMTLGHRVAVLKDGQLQQFGTPRELYDQPCNAFVAGFIGSPPMNLVPAKLADGVLTVHDRSLNIPALPRRSPGAVLLGLRPEACRLTDPHQGEGRAMFGRVKVAEDHGSIGYAHVELDRSDAAGELMGEQGAEARFIVQVIGRSLPQPGQDVAVVPDGTMARLFDPVDGAALDMAGAAGQ